MRRNGHPSRPRAITCCRFASLKTLLISTKAKCLAPKSTSRASFSLAGFQVTLIGRFWVTPEDSDIAALTRQAGFNAMQLRLGDLHRLTISQKSYLVLTRPRTGCTARQPRGSVWDLYMDHHPDDLRSCCCQAGCRTLFEAPIRSTSIRLPVVKWRPGYSTETSRSSQD